MKKKVLIIILHFLLISAIGQTDSASIYIEIYEVYKPSNLGFRFDFEMDNFSIYGIEPHNIDTYTFNDKPYSDVIIIDPDYIGKMKYLADTILLTYNKSVLLKLIKIDSCRMRILDSKYPIYINDTAFRVMPIM
jgi:hypothetical protein